MFIFNIINIFFCYCIYYFFNNWNKSFIFEFVPTFCLIKSSNSLLAPILSLLDTYLEVINLISLSFNNFQNVQLPKTTYLTLFTFISHSLISGSGINPISKQFNFPKHLVNPISLKYLNEFSLSFCSCSSLISILIFSLFFLNLDELYILFTLVFLLLMSSLSCLFTSLFICLLLLF